MTESITNTAAFLPIVAQAIDGAEQQTVDARKLHQFLEVGKDFSTWIKDRIEQFDFVENQDFASFPQNWGKGRPTVDYYVSIDMAKELSMVERNAKGKEARRYFIECEKELKAQKNAFTLPNFTDPAESAIAWAEQYKKAQEATEKTMQLTMQVNTLEKKVEMDAPKVDFYNACGDTTGMYLGSEVASFLKLNRKYFFNWCWNRGITQRRNGKWCSMKASRDKLWCFDVLKVATNRTTGTDYESSQLYFTPLGIRHIHDAMRKEGVDVPEQLELFRDGEPEVA